MAERRYFVYIMANAGKTLYIGVTNNLTARVREHKDGSRSAFTSRYRLNKLVYVEETSDVRAAIEREMQLKGWTRVRKVALVEFVNPEWDDLSEAWATGPDPSLRSG